MKVTANREMKRLMHFAKAKNHQQYLDAVFSECLRELMEKLQRNRLVLSKSKADYSKLKLVKIKDGYAFVYPQTKMVLSGDPSDQDVLIEFERGHRWGYLGLVPPTALHGEWLKAERKSKQLIIRHVSRVEYQKVLNDWVELPEALLVEGMIGGGTTDEIREQLQQMSTSEYREIEGKENIAWLLLREEYGVQSDRVSVWRGLIPDFDKLLEKKLLGNFNKMIRQERVNVYNIESEEIDADQVKEFEDGVGGKFQPPKHVSGVPKPRNKTVGGEKIEWKKGTDGVYARVKREES